MRRLSMKTKRSKSETSDSSIEENGVRRLSISDNNDEMKKGKENKNTESPRRSTAKKRSSRSRHSQKETTEDSTVKPEVVEDTQAVDTEEENKNVGKAGPSKRLKKEGSSLTKQEGNNEKEYEVSQTSYLVCLLYVLQLCLHGNKNASPRYAMLTSSHSTE